MPQREPLSAPLLGALLVVGALASGWLDLAVEALTQAGIGVLGGVPGLELVLTPPYGLPTVRIAPQGPVGPLILAAFHVAGPAAAMALGAAAHALAEALGLAGWVRVVAFEAFAFAWLRLPVVVVAAGVEGGAGPLASVYGGLGEPETGRWTAIALGLLLLWWISGLVAGRAVAMGREWLRVDGAAFRRRLVRLVAAYPFVVATVAFALGRAVAPPGWTAALLAAAVGCLMLQSR